MQTIASMSVASMSAAEPTQERPFVVTTLCGWFFSRRFRDCPQSGSGITPFGGVWWLAGSGSVPDSAPIPLKGGVRFPLLASSQAEFSSRTGSTSIGVPICLQLTPFYLPPTPLHYNHS